VGEPSGAVFLSYASEDAEAARRICDALRADGIEVWFDQNELRGGDLWDQSIRQQIRDCSLFIPVISQHTQERLEGYFRREWRLAVDRTLDMAEHRSFIVPIAIDDTVQRTAHVPQAFNAAQWTKLPDGNTPQAFVDRIKQLLSPAPAVRVETHSASTAHGRQVAGRPRRNLLLAIAGVGLAALGAFGAIRFSKETSGTPKEVALPIVIAPRPAFSPPPHSIAVLPFVNMSGDKEQEYFSEGLTEELLNSLSRIDQLQVAARTSSFSFQDQHPDIATVAHKLNVAAVLEGSVRRSGNTLRVTTQLINGVTGFHLWSETYDRNLRDVLQLQTEIATSIASALKVKLFADEAVKIELGGTHKPEAFDAYLRGSSLYLRNTDAKDIEGAIAEYSKAITLDPQYALAYAQRSFAHIVMADRANDDPTFRKNVDAALADGQKATAMAPTLAEGHLALGWLHEYLLEFASASAEYARALALAPGKARAQRLYGAFAVEMGDADAGLAAIHRAIVLDPLNSRGYFFLGKSLVIAKRYDEAMAALQRSHTLDANDPEGVMWTGLAHYGKGDYENARSTCEEAGEDWKYFCLAISYDRLKMSAEAEKARARMRTAWGGDNKTAALNSMFYAQRGDISQALDWLERARKAEDNNLVYVKCLAWFDPLRKEPRFQAIERELKFPN
jgi:TolB-like protein